MEGCLSDSPEKLRPSSFWNFLAFSLTKRRAMASFSSSRKRNLLFLSAANIQRSTVSTPASALALSRVLRALLGITVASSLPLPVRTDFKILSASWRLTSRHNSEHPKPLASFFDIQFLQPDQHTLACRLR